MQRGLDELHGRLPFGTADGEASREILDAYRLVASDAGWLRRVSDAVRDGLSANAAVQRVAAEVHDRMRRITDPLLRERLADLEDMAGRLLDELGGAPAAASAQGAILIARATGSGRAVAMARSGHCRGGDRGGNTRRARRNPVPGTGASRPWVASAASYRPRSRGIT